MTEVDLELGDGRTLHAYDTGAGVTDGRLAVFWHHGTPNIGTPPEPLFAAAEELGIRWVSYDRPGYGGSTAYPGRTVASAAPYVAVVADALSIDRFAVMGHSGGGSHALACGALLPERVLGVVSVAGLAPFGAEGLDWFAGMADSGVASAMSLAALGVVLGHVAICGVVREADEGTAAHIWQLLIAAQIPFVGFFTVRWLPRAPRRAVPVLALQGGAALAALAPVFFLNL